MSYFTSLATFYTELSELLSPAPGKDYGSAAAAALTRLEEFCHRTASHAFELDSVKKKLDSVKQKHEQRWTVMAATTVYAPPDLNVNYALVGVGFLKDKADERAEKEMEDFLRKAHAKSAGGVTDPS